MTILIEIIHKKSFFSTKEWIERKYFTDEWNLAINKEERNISQQKNTILNTL